MGVGSTLSSLTEGHAANLTDNLTDNLPNPHRDPDPDHTKAADRGSIAEVRRMIEVIEVNDRAADWNLQEPSWTGRMRLVSQGDSVTIKLEDKMTGELFAKCPIEQYPGIAVEPVTDSSRYFVLRIQDDNGRSAFIGVGFLDRSDSFDLNVALQDHFKWVKKQEQIDKEKDTPKQELDLRFKEGETIKINMKITKKDGSEVASKTKQRPNANVGLPAPPGGVKIAPPPAKTPTSSPAHKPVQNLNQTNSEWGEFASASQQSGTQPPSTPGNASWVQF